MRIGNKVFPYPILNNNNLLTGYNNSSSFALKLDTKENGELIIEDKNVILKNIHFILVNDELNDLYSNNKLKCALIVESASALFRNITYINDTPVDLSYPIYDFSDDVYISAYIYATDDLNSYTNEDFNEDYDGYMFDIEKYDILAIDDGFKFWIDIDSDLDNKVESIFTIVKRDSNEQQIQYESDTNKIKIFVSPEYYDYYISMKDSSYGINVIFAILLIPTLSSCLSEIKSSVEDNDIEDIIEQKKWFKSICLSYESVTGTKLDLEDFKEINTLNLAQLVLNNATCNGLKDFANILFNGIEGGAEDE